MEGTGPYDRLYQNSNLLWPDRPGRMVKEAASLRSEGRALDVGCGDGKNLAYLERLGWIVDGIDVSSIAIEAARRRLRESQIRHRGTLALANVTSADFGTATYDLVVCYGLYHCLTDAGVEKAQATLVRALRPGGLFAFAVFNNDLPVPPDHCTDGLILRPADHLPGLLCSWRRIALETGQIEESHPPLVGLHRHALTWGLFERSR